MICPYCQQGTIMKAIVNKTKEKIMICDECDTVWENADAISDLNGVSFDTYMNCRKIQPLWQNIFVGNAL